MAKPPPQVDVLVLGDHPCAYLAAILLHRKGVSVLHSRIPGESLSDRLVMINPQFFELDEVLRPMKRRMDLVATYGLKFVADVPELSNSSVRKTISAYVGSLKQVHSELSRMSKLGGVASISPQTLTIDRVDEQGLTIRFNGGSTRSRLLLLAGELPDDAKRVLGIAPWLDEARSRYTFFQMKGSVCQDFGSHPLVVMSLNLRETHHWAWLLPGPGKVQIAIEQPCQGLSGGSPRGMVEHWVAVLLRHGILKKSNAERAVPELLSSMELPLGGALTGEGVANRTLCFGPAGGFFTACAEDVYPNCWSAVCAADVACKSLKERHLQDALQSYRQSWGSTLGDYLRGPQENLRFLLPLVYRNSAMASRLTDAILLGKSVVR